MFTACLAESWYIPLQQERTGAAGHLYKAAWLGWCKSTCFCISTCDRADDVSTMVPRHHPVTLSNSGFASTTLSSRYTLTPTSISVYVHRRIYLVEQGRSTRCLVIRSQYQDASVSVNVLNESVCYNGANAQSQLWQAATGSVLFRKYTGLQSHPTGPTLGCMLRDVHGEDIPLAHRCRSACRSWLGTSRSCMTAAPPSAAAG